MPMLRIRKRKIVLWTIRAITYKPSKWVVTLALAAPPQSSKLSTEPPLRWAVLKNKREK